MKNLQSQFVKLLLLVLIVSSCEPPDDDTLVVNEFSPEIENFYIDKLLLDNNQISLNEDFESNDTNLLFNVCQSQLPQSFSDFTVFIAVPTHPDNTNFEVGISFDDDFGIIVQYGELNTGNVLVEGSLVFDRIETDRDGEGDVSIFKVSGSIPNSEVTNQIFTFINAIFDYKYRPHGESSEILVSNRAFTIKKSPGC